MGNKCRDDGIGSKPTITRYYFDTATGSCRSFEFSRCGGNANNFDTLEQCEGFCLDNQCPKGVGLRAGPALATCSAAASISNNGGVDSIGANKNMFATPQASPPFPILDQCPSHYLCEAPKFGVSFICCSAPENVCREPVQAGAPCFGAYTTFTRFYYNAEKDQCEPFQYYGCGGSGNNFITKRQCENSCLPSLKTVCNGVSPINDEGDYVRRCSETVPCPAGSWCNQHGYCCPHQEKACTSPRSIGHTCLTQRPGTHWYYDSTLNACQPFTYSGCGGTPNRFNNRESCEQMCDVAGKGVGQCPRGMTPFLTAVGVRRCSNTIGGSKNPDCPDGSSCVQSTIGEWICCSSTAQCPIGRSAYLIPGSASNVACIPDDAVNNCPQNFQCVQSSNVPGFFMCCSSTPVQKRLMAISRSSNSIGAVLNVVDRAVSNRQSSMDAYNAPLKCPNGLHSNGERCALNEIEACPSGYICVGDSGAGADNMYGICCKAFPKCLRRGQKAYYLSKRQVFTCNGEEGTCPSGTKCQRSTLPLIDICCMNRMASNSVTDFISATAQPSHGGKQQRIRSSSSSSAQAVSSNNGGSSTVRRQFSKGVPKVVPKCVKDGSLPYFALGSRTPQQCIVDRDDECPEEYECEQASDDNYYCCPAWDRCPAGASPFLVEGSRKPLGCNWMANNCPEGYSCEGSKDRAICCRTRPSAAQCPIGRSPYLMAKRPLVCPLDAKKNTCPVGYECIPSRKGGINVCCSKLEHQTPECVVGHAFFDAATGKNMVCDPALDSCPVGYRCKRSTMAHTHVCCTIQLDNRYDGYCPPGNIPYLGTTSGQSDEYALVPPTCHVVNNPCPTSGPYQCIYSVEKQNSYCCAPADISPRNNVPFRQWSNTNSHTRAAPYQLPIQFQQQKGIPEDPIGCGSNIPSKNNNVDKSFIPMNAYLSAIGSSSGGNSGADATSSFGPASQFYGTTNGASAADQSSLQQQQQLMANCQMQRLIQQQQQQFLQQQGVGNGNGAQYVQFPTFGGLPTDRQLQAQQEEIFPGSASSSLFIASCPPLSKPLIDAQTGLGQACSVWDRCPSGFTCYSNFPDGRSAHCCTTVPLDNQVVFRANVAQMLADSSGQPSSYQQWSSPPAAGATADSSASNGASSYSTSFVPSGAASPELQQFSPPASGLQFSPTKNDGSRLEATNITMPLLILNGTGIASVKPCPPNMLNIGGLCKRMYFAGQQGCELDTQCTARTNNTRCMRGYCTCQDGQLIHESQCVHRCPDGFLTAAGRCHDLSTVVFMDSVEDRDNGTIGGFCKDTIILEEQCVVENSYCSERTLTCQCKPGFELRMDFVNHTDSGRCAQVSDSKFSKVLRDGKTIDFALDDGDEDTNSNKIGENADDEDFDDDADNTQEAGKGTNGNGTVPNRPPTFYAVMLSPEEEQPNAQQFATEKTNSTERNATLSAKNIANLTVSPSDRNRNASLITAIDSAKSGQKLGEHNENAKNPSPSAFVNTTNPTTTPSFFFQSDD